MKTTSVWRNVISMRFIYVCLILVLGFSSQPASAALTAREQKAFSKAIRLFTAKSYARSARLLRALAKRDPRNGLIYFNLGNALFMQGSLEDALRAYEDVVSLRSPLAPAAQMYAAKVLGRLGRVNEARGLLLRLSEQSLLPAMRTAIANELSALADGALSGIMLERALALYRKGEHQAALNALPTTTADLGTDGLLLKSILLIRLERFRDARTPLKKVARFAKSSADRRAARDLLAALEDRGIINEESWLFVEASIGANSNPLLNAEGDPALRGGARGAVGGGYRFLLWSDFSVRPGYTLSLDHTIDLPALRETVHALTLPIEFESGTLSFGAGPFFTHRDWNGPALQKSGLRAKAEWQPENYSVGVDYETAQQTNLDLNYSYLRGQTQRFRVFLGASIFPAYVHLLYTFSEEHIGDLTFTSGLLPLRHVSQGPGIRLIWRGRRDWYARLQTDYLTRTYTTAAQPTGKMREDRQLAADLRFAIRPSTGLELFIEAGIVSNTSTLGATDVSDKNYRANWGSVGVSYDLL